MSPSPVNDDPRTRVGMGAAQRNDRAHRSGRSLIVPVRDAEPEGRWQELVETFIGHVASDRNRFDRLIKPFGRLFQLLIIYPG